MLYQAKLCDYFLVFVVFFNFKARFTSFKGVSPWNELLNPKLKISNFLVLWRRDLNKTSQDKIGAFL